MSTTIVTAYTPGTVYEEIAKYNEAQCEAFGYYFAGHELLPSNDLVGPVPSARFKPAIVHDAVVKRGGRDAVWWVDADAVILRPLDLPPQVDLLVTLRDRNQVGQTGRYDTDFLNSGVVGFRCSVMGRHAAETWEAITKVSTGDQAALNQIVAEPWMGTDPKNWIASQNRITYHYRNFWTQVIVPCAKWNYLGWPAPPQAGCRVIHFRHGNLDLIAKQPGGWRKVVEQCAS